MYKHVIWPQQYDPKTSAIYALNDIDVNAQPAVVWKLLIDARNWSSYFPAEDEVRILSGEPELALGTQWTRVTVGIPTRLIVTECVPISRLAWSTMVDGDETGSSAYHGWVITPTHTGCHVLSEETQQGPFFLEELGRKNPGALYRYHQKWVESLARAAEAEAAKSKESDIGKVLTVLQGIGSGDADLATSHINPKKYIEHNPRLTGGVVELREYINRLSKEDHRLKVVRAFQDGHYVFTQEDGLILGQNTFFEVFRFEDGLIVEHWVFSAQAAPANESGHTQTDGPTQANLSENTEKNKSILRDYYETVHISGDHSRILQYFSGDYCVRHEPGVRDGVGAFIHDLGILMQHRSIDEVKFLLGERDFVFIVAMGTVEGEPCVYVDLYRVEDEKIAEHWGFPEKIPPSMLASFAAAGHPSRRKL